MNNPVSSVIRLFITALLCAVSLPSVAKAPLHTQQAPGWFRIMVGQDEVTALNDGFIQQDTKLLKNIKPEQIKTYLQQHFIDGQDGVTTAVNAFLVNTGKQLILIDSGAGHCFGPALGNVPKNLQASGYQPEQVDAILITHMHSDHLCGITDSNGHARYPNATLYLPRADSDYWLDSSNEQEAKGHAKDMFINARKAVAPYKAAKRIKTFTSNEQLFDNISAIATHGHTPGHTSYLIQSGHASMLVWGDIMHNINVQMPQPDVAIDYDTDSALAVKARKNLLQRLADTPRWIAGAHLPFPGIGHIRSQSNDGYRWYPALFEPVTRPTQP